MTYYNYMLDAALSYARRGWKILPLHTIADQKCSCKSTKSCKPGKHPRYAKGLIEHGCRDATTDETTIREFWERWPDANIGIATGAASGIVVLDIDNRHCGNVELEGLLHQYGNLPDTVEAVTGNGRHIYLQHPGYKITSRVGGSAIRNGVEIIGDGGYVVAPPSHHESGVRYEWEASTEPETKLAHIPQWLLDELNMSHISSAREKVISEQTTANSKILLPAVITAEEASNLYSTSTGNRRRELDIFQQFVRCIQKYSENRYKGLCPFHDDTNPSFIFEWIDERSKFFWRCQAECAGSQVKHGDDIGHWGDLLDMLCILEGHPAGILATERRELDSEDEKYYQLVEQILNLSLRNGSNAERLAKVVLGHGINHGVDLRKDGIYCSRRTIATLDNRLDEITADNGLRFWGHKIIRAENKLKQIGIDICGTPYTGRRKETTTYYFDKLISRYEHSEIVLIQPINSYQQIEKAAA